MPCAYSFGYTQSLDPGEYPEEHRKVFFDLKIEFSAFCWLDGKAAGLPDSVVAACALAYAKFAEWIRIEEQALENPTPSRKTRNVRRHSVCVSSANKRSNFTEFCLSKLAVKTEQFVKFLEGRWQSGLKPRRQMARERAEKRIFHRISIRACELGLLKSTKIDWFAELFSGLHLVCV